MAWRYLRRLLEPVLSRAAAKFPAVILDEVQYAPDLLP
jgi:hypothetical protein